MGIILMLLGTIVNALAIAVASLIGTRIRNVPEGMSKIVMQALSLCLLIIGIQMGVTGENFLIVIASLTTGAMIGEWLQIDARLNKLGDWLGKKLGKESQGNVAQAFISSTLIFAAGALAILGPLESALRGDHSLLFTKASIDGFSALIISSTLGIGVLFAAIPVFLYQSIITLLASQIDAFVSPALMDLIIAELTCIGGIMILAIGLNLLNITNIKIANLLPSLVIVVALVVGFQGMLL
ncbi:DUF554 domain-containing protein [Bacillus sp. JCM 19041]|uniref:DUF554 domain-containing protein n=1 Tax=Bacillus sp. JCM 19041 TaxID=1460637 RepID=UPI0006D21E63